MDALRQRFTRVVAYDGRSVPLGESPFAEASNSSYIHWVNGIELSQGMLDGQRLDLVIAAGPQASLDLNLRLLDERFIAAKRLDVNRVGFDVWFANPSVFLRVSQFWRFAQHFDPKHLYVHLAPGQEPEKAWDFWLRSQRLRVTPL